MIQFDEHIFQLGGSTTNSPTSIPLLKPSGALHGAPHLCLRELGWSQESWRTEMGDKKSIYTTGVGDQTTFQQELD